MSSTLGAAASSSHRFTGLCAFNLKEFLGAEGGSSATSAPIMIRAAGGPLFGIASRHGYSQTVILGSWGLKKEDPTRPSLRVRRLPPISLRLAPDQPQILLLSIQRTPDTWGARESRHRLQGARRWSRACCRPRDGLKDCLPFTANGLARDDGNKNLRSAARHQVWASKAFGALNVKSRVNAFTTYYGRIVDKRAGLLRVDSLVKGHSATSPRW